jgi:4-hydroxythreonine-4-phosphate dehydrogenase
MPKKIVHIAITTGDADGIGTEVTAKALLKIGPVPNVFFYLWRSPKCPKAHLAMIDRKFKRITVSTWPEALKANRTSSKQIVDICSNLPPPMWVETTAQSSYFGHIDAMATAPLSKTAIAECGMKDIGHTDILARICKEKHLYQAFVGAKFHVVLASAHLPLDKVVKSVTTENLERAVLAAEQLRRWLPKKNQKRPVALLGLNPHAGEDGLIGSEEQNIHKPLVEKLIATGVNLVGPLVPDAAFFKENWDKFSVYVANYHDQGLIPFKMIHGQESGLHITLGLPFVRTSVDHGTAKNIFGRNKANPASMRLAIEWAVQLSRGE